MKRLLVIALLYPLAAQGQTVPGRFPANTVYGNPTGAEANPITMSQAQLTALCNAFSTVSATAGCVPGSSTGGTVNFLRADGTWAAPPPGTVTSVATSGGLTGGTITSSGTLSLANIAQNTVLGSITVGSTTPVALTATQLTTLCNTFSTSTTLPGCVPGSNAGGASVFLNGNGGWTTPGGGGTVTSVAAGVGITVSPSPIIGAGTVTLANPSATTIGGVQSKTAVASQWLNSISTSGVPSSTQPAFTDLSGSIAGSQLPAYTGDVTKPAASTVTTLANIPNATPMAGDVLATNIAVPGTPAAGKSFVYVDSTNKVLSVKTDVPTVSNTVVPSTAAANSFATAVSAAGVVTYTQPAFTNLTGSVAAGQMPALTGDVTSTAGTVATTIAANVVTNAKMATMAANTVKGSIAGGNPIDLTATQLTTLCNVFATAATTSGCVAGSNSAGATSFLNGTNAWSVPAGTAKNIVTVYAAGTTTGTTHTFNAVTVSVRFVGCGPGGGGGSGSKQASGTSSSGASGGGGGGCFDKWFKASDLPASVNVVVGTGGGGAAAPGAGPVVGVTGTAGNVATCVSSAASCGGTLYTLGGLGGGGAGGQLTTNSGSGAGGCVINNAAASIGGTGTGAAAGGPCGNGTFAGYGSTPATCNQVICTGAGGGGGGGILNANAPGGALQFMAAAGGGAGGGVPTSATTGTGATAVWNGGNSGYIYGIQGAINAGGTLGTPAGASGATFSVCLAGSAGAGGVGNFSGNGGNGGNGAQGSAGGGGGSTISANTPGTGGNGGNGFLCVYEFM